MLTGVVIVELYVAGLNADATALLHRVAGIDDEVDQNLLELPRVGDYVSTCATGRADADVFPNQTAQHRLDIPDHGIQVEHPRLEDLLSAEREQLSSQCRGPLGCVPDLSHILAARIGRIEAIQNHLGV